ncbi:hypothetical protein EHP00_473 [Ecytonucleospora hepatopenaei]|uniref:Uncharacterized protein n=1 Tax=Ecytonucleospora hepatopenaei TaxID=646526 RepID=A0A1W0E8V8_9MICR|nr:hypothetical protein EHP00_2590 [Ecytonucleospora hepatopenaei]OQS55756.1 hypothetical protein EHP00_473 [Ecytonucleospora hepatopenaei]
MILIFLIFVYFVFSTSLITKRCDENTELIVPKDTKLLLTETLEISSKHMGQHGYFTIYEFKNDIPEISYTSTHVKYNFTLEILKDQYLEVNGKKCKILDNTIIDNFDGELQLVDNSNDLMYLGMVTQKSSLYRATINKEIKLLIEMPLEVSITCKDDIRFVMKNNRLSVTDKCISKPLNLNYIKRIARKPRNGETPVNNYNKYFDHILTNVDFAASEEEEMFKNLDGMFLFKKSFLDKLSDLSYSGLSMKNLKETYQFNIKTENDGVKLENKYRFNAEFEVKKTPIPPVIPDIDIKPKDILPASESKPKKEEKKESKTALILSIIIPISIVMLLIISYLIYIKIKTSKQKNQNQYNF